MSKTAEEKLMAAIQALAVQVRSLNEATASPRKVIVRWKGPKPSLARIADRTLAGTGSRPVQRVTPLQALVDKNFKQES